MATFDQGLLLQQAKKGQADTNGRLEALIAEQRRTNELLAHLISLLTPQTAPQHTSRGNNGQ